MRPIKRSDASRHSAWHPPADSVGITQSHGNTCFTCGHYVAPNEGAIEHEFDGVICPNCIRHMARGDYRKHSGKKQVWKKGSVKTLDKKDNEAAIIRHDLHYSGHI